jgi:branched-subunit amino acid transport protein
MYQKERNANSRNILFILILIFSNRLLIKMSFENRPELMLAALGFGSFLCLQTKSATVSKSLLAGVLAGMAMLCHLNGIIYLIAGFGTLLYFRQYKNASYFALAGGLTGLVYFSDILLADNGFSIWILSVSQ